MGNDRVKLAAAMVLVLGLMAAAVWVQAARERAYPLPEQDEASLYVTSPTAVRRLSLAYTALAADLYWIRAIQYYGGTKRELASQWPEVVPPPMLAADPSAGYPLLYPLLDLTTSLDPRFNVAYRFGAIFLAEPYPRGPGRPDLAVALLQKGLRERPDRWEYMQDIGFVYYWYGNDYRTAAGWFEKASLVPGGPWWLRSMAATTLAQGGDRRSSRQMWLAIRQSAEIDWLRQDADRRLAQLRALDDIDLLKQKVETFSRRTGGPPADWPSLIRSGLVPGVAVDPAGRPYELGSDGTVRMSRSSPLWPLPEEPAAAPPRPPA
jgi:hypothetical protein